MVRFAVPVFCRVTVFAALVDPTLWFPKLKAVGVMLICAATGLTPFPESETVVGGDGAVLVTFREPACDPIVTGLKLTLTRAVCPGVRTAGLAYVGSANDSTPVTSLSRMATFALTEVCRVTVFAALVDPTLWFFLMIRLRARSTLLPSTSLFRSESETVVGGDGAVLVTFREPACEPTVAGLKLTLTRAVTSSSPAFLLA